VETETGSYHCLDFTVYRCSLPFERSADMWRCMPLSSLITPATLYIIPSMQSSWSQHMVPSLSIYGTQWSRFSYSINDTATSPLLFLGPRTVISRITTATATNGKILGFTAPWPNSSYSLQFHGPVIRCQDANLTTANIIEALRDQVVHNSTGSIVEYNNNYFAFVPNLSGLGNDLSSSNGVQITAQSRLQVPSNASNNLWMVFSRYARDVTGDISIVDCYITCSLYNASYNLDLSFNNGLQSVNVISIILLNVIEYPSNNALNTTDVQQQHAYSAVFWAISDLIVGSMGLFRTSSGNTTVIFPEITTELERTSLLGSSDLYVFFDGTTFTEVNGSNSDQRQADIDLAKNRTLAVLIEELSSNVTISFLSSNLFS
jgi:hypothetical protein